MRPSYTRYQGLVVALLAVVSVTPGMGHAGAPRPPNIVLILTDDLGYADLGCTGSKDIRTPHIDRLARGGVRFTNFYSNGPVCTPTRAALMTGRWQQRVGLEWAIGPGVHEPGLPSTEPTLPRLLKSAGYHTALAGKWHLGYKPEFAPGAHGFDSFFGLLSGNVDHYSHREINGDPDWYRDTKPTRVEGYSTDLLTDEAVRVIERRPKDRPFFLYLAYNAVHWPFQPPDRPDVRARATWFEGTRKDYVAMTERVDAGVGKLLEALDRAGVADDTVVIFTNDNGGERLSDNRPFFHHKASLWEGGIRVPCIVRWPGGKLPAGAVSDQVGITMDLTRSVLGAAGVSPPADRPPDGVDLLGLVRAKKQVERTLFWRIERPDRKQRAVRLGKWKLVRDGGFDQLFDLEADPGERRTLAYQQPEKLAALRAALAGWEKEMNASKPRFVVK